MKIFILLILLALIPIVSGIEAYEDSYYCEKDDILIVEDAGAFAKGRWQCMNLSQYYLQSNGQQILDGNLLVTGNLSVLGNTEVRNVTAVNYNVTNDMSIAKQVNLYNYTACDRLTTNPSGLLVCSTMSDFYTKEQANNTFLKLDQTNWNHDTWILYDETINNFYFNETKLSGSFYYPVKNYTESGTVQDGNISLLSFYDGRSFNITEQVPVGLLYYANITGVPDSLNRLCLRYEMDSTNDINHIYLWDYSSSNWQHYFDLKPTAHFDTQCIDIFDPTDHNVGGLVQIKIEHTGIVSNQHVLKIDYLWAVTGYLPITSTEVDPHSIHTDYLNYSYFNFSNGVLQWNRPDPITNGTDANLNKLTVSNNLYTNRLFMGDSTEDIYYIYFSDAGTYEAAYILYNGLVNELWVSDYVDFKDSVEIDGDLVVSGDFQFQGGTLNGDLFTRNIYPYGAGYDFGTSELPYDTGNVIRLNVGEIVNPGGFDSNSDYVDFLFDGIDMHNHNIINISNLETNVITLNGTNITDFSQIQPNLAGVVYNNTEAKLNLTDGNTKLWLDEEGLNII